MYARITSYKMKPGLREEATALLQSLKESILGLNGMKEFINVMNEDGSGYVVSLVESKAASDGNAEAVKAIWSNFSEYLESVPSAEGYDVIAHWPK